MGQWRLDTVPRRGKAAIFLPRNDSKFEEGTGLAAMAASAGSPWVPRKEPHGPTAFRNYHFGAVPAEREPDRCAPGWGDCYLFMCRVSPHTCARILAARRSLPLAPAWHGLEEPSGLGTWATATHPKPAELLEGDAASSVPSAELPRAGPGENMPLAPPLGLNDPVSFLLSRLLKIGPTHAPVVSRR